MRLHDRHDRLTAAAIQAGWVEGGSLGPEVSYTIRHDGKRYVLQYWDGDIERGARTFWYDRLDRARYDAARLCAGGKPYYGSDE